MPTVHWKPFDPDCGCQCETSHCDLQTVCNSIWGNGVFGPYGEDRDGNGRLLIVTVQSKDGTSDCNVNCTCGEEGCPDAPVGEASSCCKPGPGRGLPSQLNACWLPVLQTLANSYCLHFDMDPPVDVTCNDIDDVHRCCDQTTTIHITWLI